MTSKRYVLLQADGEVASEEWSEFARSLELRFGRLKVITIRENRRFLVVRTDNEVAPKLRECGDMMVGEKRVKSVLTSGSIGKLKRLAGKSSA